MRAIFGSWFRENPMRIEISRFRRRFLGFGGSGLTSAVLALVLLLYVGLVMLVVNLRGDLPPVALIMFQTVLFCFFGPAMLHGAIAGERERRSWDLLLVAPITKAQIVAGKFMGALAALGVGAAAMGLPVLIAALGYRKTTLWDLLLAEAVSLSFCTLVCSWTIFLSARAKRPFMALGATLGSLALGLLVVPALFVSLAGGDRFSSEIFLALNPFTALASLMNRGDGGSLYGDGAVIDPSLYGVPHVLIYLFLTLAFLVYAERTLNFAENEVRFLPKGGH